MKKGFFLFLVLYIVTLSTNVYAFDVVKPTNDFYINDYADVLDKETEDYILEHSINLYNKTTAQIVVVTVEDLDNTSIEEYSLKLARSFEIGTKGKDNGILLLVSENDRKVRIEVGYGFESTIPDGKAGRLLDDYVIPYLKDNDWNNGILNGYKAIYKEVNDFYKLNEEVDAPVEPAETDDFIISMLSMLFVGKIMYTIILLGIKLDSPGAKLINFLILEFLTCLITAGSYFSSADSGALFFLVFGTIANIAAVNIYLESSGGYYGGGSGGHYRGGGFSGGHHGGGGSFGGGGASRGF